VSHHPGSGRPGVGARVLAAPDGGSRPSGGGPDGEGPYGSHRVSGPPILGEPWRGTSTARLNGTSRAPVGGHTDADTLGHTLHERTPRWLVIPPSAVAHAAETGPAPGSTVPHGPGVHRAPSHTPAAP